MGLIVITFSFCLFFFIAFKFFYTLVIIFLQGFCLSFFLLWAHVKVIHLQGFFLPQFVFTLHIIFQGFSLLVSSFPWPMTPISLALPMLFPSHLIILFPSQLLWGCLFNRINVQPRLHLTYLFGLSPLPSFIAPPQWHQDFWHPFWLCFFLLFFFVGGFS